MIKCDARRDPENFSVWWVDLGWLSGVQQTTLSLLFKRTGEKKTTKRLWVELRTQRSLSNYHNEQNVLDLENLTQFSVN